MKLKQLFETTLYGEDPEAALSVLSVPVSHGGHGPAASPAYVLYELRLRPVAEVPPGYLADALAAILAADHAYEAADWLREPPNPTPVALGEDVLWLEPPAGGASDAEVPQLVPSRSDDWDDFRVPSSKPRRKVAKTDPRARELREFAGDVAKGGVVPFQRSPIDLVQLPDLLQAGEAARTFIVTVRSNPLVFVWLSGGGFLLASALRGTGKGLSAGLQYRVLKWFGVPEDIIRQQMQRRR